MSHSGPKNHVTPPEPPQKTEEPQPTLVTKEGVQIFVREVWTPPPEPEPEPEPEPPGPHTIIIPASQLAAERAAFIASLDKEWGALIDKELARRNDVAPASVEDAHQEVLIVLCKHHDAQREAGKPVTPDHMRAFLCKVVDNVVLNHATKKKRRPVFELGAEAEMDEAAASAPDPEQAAALAEGREKLARYRTQLSVLEQAVFGAREDDGMSFEDIGEKLELPKSTVHSVYERAVEKIEQLMAASQRRAALRKHPVDSRK